MRVELEAMIDEMRLRMGKEKSLRNKVLLEKSLGHLVEYKKSLEAVKPI